MHDVRFIVLTMFFTLCPACLGMDKHFTTPQKWALGYYTTKIIPCKKSKLYPPGDILYSSTSLNLDVTGKFIVSGRYYVKEKEWWLKNNQQANFYDPETGIAVSRDQLQPNHYYYVDGIRSSTIFLRQRKIFTFMGIFANQTSLEEDLILQSPPHLTICCTTGETKKDITTYGRHSNSSDAELYVDFVKNQMTLILNDDFTSNERQKIIFSPEKPWGEYRIDVGAWQRSTTHAHKEILNGYLILSAVELTMHKVDYEAKEKFFMIHVSETEATLLCEPFEYNCQRFFLSPDGTIAGYYDDKQEQFVVLKVLDHVPGIFNPEKLNGLRDIFWSFN